MYPRVNYEMTEDDLKELLESCKPVPYMVMGGSAPSSPQENANRAWARLGSKMGFDHMTVQPIPGRGQRFFTAVPTETEDQGKEREKKEFDENKTRNIQAIKQKIADLNKELSELYKLNM